MKIVSKVIIISSMLGLFTQASHAQRTDTGGWLLDFGGAALVSQTQPTGLGGAIAGGYSARDFNILLRPQVLIAEPGVAQKILLIPAFLFEVKIRLLPGFLTLLPYINGGVIGSKVKLANGSLSSNVFTYYAEAGIGADILLTHEISVVPRIGIASALLYSDQDSNNHSGMTVSVAMRYTFSRSKSLDY